MRNCWMEREKEDQAEGILSYFNDNRKNVTIITFVNIGSLF
jgi:hypothetical protein